MVHRNRTSRHPIKQSHSRKNWPLIITLLILVGAGSFIGVLVFAATDLPVWNSQQLTGTDATLLYDDEGKVFSRLHAEENRTAIDLEKVPNDLVEAFIATEDQDFYNHHGVNFKGIIRAVLHNLQSRDLTGQGASTITQQLARNAFLSLDKKWERKIKEVILAFKLESSYSKDEIMSMYLNKIYFGAGAYGVQAAANTYFGKDVSSLNLAESSMLAGLVQSPNYYNPFQNFDKAKTRQKTVLNNMVNCGFINNETAEQAYSTQLHLIKGHNTGEKYGFFVDSVVEEALQDLSKVKGYEDTDRAVYRAGLKIYTTMNADLQSYAEEYFKNPANFPNQKSPKGDKIQVGMAVVKSDNGEVKAVMGGREYEQQRGFNRATSAYRSPGSSIKPLTVYGPALEKGLMPYTVLDDSPLSYKMGGTVWNPENYDHKYRGLITMRTAVQLSINTYAIQLLDKIGIRTGFDFGKNLGLNLIDSPGKNDLSLAPLSLGGLTDGATPVQMAGAYACYSNGGIYVKPHFITRIVDNKGLVLYEYKAKYKRVMREDTAWLMDNMLQTVVNSGTGTSAKVAGVPTGGKTGTSEDLTDAWFCGITPVYASAVWMGYDNQKYKMYNVFGGSQPAWMFKAMMQKAHQKCSPGSWPMPANIVQVSVCSKSGLLPSATCPEDQIVSEYCIKKYLPTETCTSHQTIVVCKESGKLAGKYCPDTEVISAVKAGSNSAEVTKIPTEKCDIHTSFNIPGLFKNTVKVCKDPQHNGKLYKARIPGANQSGGCPSQYVVEIITPPGENLTYCPIESHQLKKKTKQDVINNIFE